MKRRYIVVLIIMIVCILSTIKFTYGRFTYESEITGTVTTTSRNPFNVGTLAYSIVDNAMKAEDNSDSTIYRETPLSIPGGSTMEETERTLSVTQDDDGNSYYFRGNVLDNYIDFNNMCWRIVRIEGDGSIKLILEDKEKTCSETTEDGSNSNIGTGTYGYNSTKIDSKTFSKADYEKCTTDSNQCMKKQFDKWLTENNFDKRLLKNDEWNIGDWETLYPRSESANASGSGHYDVGRRLRGYQLNDERRFLTKLTTTEKDIKVEDYIGTLTADEVAFSGSSDIENTITYTYLKILLNNIDTNNILLLSPAYRSCNTTSCTDNEYMFNGKRLHNVNYGVVATGLLIPSIVLKKDIKIISGDGTKNNAYKVDENPFDEGTLAYEIVKNAQNVKNGETTTNTTKLSSVPETVPAQEASKEDERTLSITEDDYGSSYYYRGNVQDNYLNFNNMCWKIVRIQGDGSIKLILQDKNIECNENTQSEIENASIGVGTYGYKTININDKNYYQMDYENCTSDSETCIKNKLTNWFNENFKEETLLTKIKNDTWYLGNQKDYYSNNGDKIDKYLGQSRAYSEEGKIYQLKIGNADLKFINNDTIESNIGILSVNEYAFSGMFAGFTNTRPYLYLNNICQVEGISKKCYNWTSTFVGTTNITPYRDMIFSITGSGADINIANAINIAEVEYGGDVIEYQKNLALIRPSIVLNKDIKIKSGNGTKQLPYEVT